MYHLEQVVAPTEPPLAPDEVKNFLRVDDGDPQEDALVSSLIDAARGYLEGPNGILSRCLIEQTWKLSLTCFSGNISLPLPPVKSIDKIEYTNSNGLKVTVPTTVYELASERIESSTIVLKAGEVWPTDISDSKALPVEVTFTCGLSATAADLPTTLKVAMMSWIANLYENRSSVNGGNISNAMPTHFRTLVSNYRVRKFGQ